MQEEVITIPIIQSAKKRLRQSKKRRERNLARKATYKLVAKQIKNKISAGDKKGASALLPELAKAADKAAKSNAIHKNKASRIKSRLTRKVQSL